MSVTPPPEFDARDTSLHITSHNAGSKRRKSRPAQEEQARQNYLALKKLIGDDLVFLAGDAKALQCHHCHSYVKPHEHYVRCNVAVVASKAGKPCNKVYHLERVCLIGHYKDDEIRSVRPDDKDHDFVFLEPKKSQWACPVCRDICVESNCRAKKNKKVLLEGGEIPKSATKTKQRLSLPTAPPSSSTSPQPPSNFGLTTSENLVTTPGSSAPSPAADDLTSGSGQENAMSDTRLSKKLLTTPQSPTLKTKAKATTEKRERTLQKMIVEKRPLEDKKITALKRKAANISGDEATSESDKEGGFETSPRKKPSFVSDPNFQFIQIDHADDDIHKKLFIREFLVRFGRDPYGIQQTHLKAAENPNREWNASFYKSIIMSLLEFVPEDAAFDNDEICDRTNECIKSIKRMPADNPQVWEQLAKCLRGVSPFIRVKTMDWDSMDYGDQAIKLALLESLMQMMTHGEAFRMALKFADQKMKAFKQKQKDAAATENHNFNDKKARLKTEEENLSKDDTATLQQIKARLKNESKQHKHELEDIEFQFWLQTRKVDYRYAEPLGMDILGNIYSAYSPLVDGADGWGAWIIVAKGKRIVHPLGYFPPDTEDKNDSHHTWFAIDGADDLDSLIDWIGYTAEKAWYEKELGKYKSPMKPRKSASSSTFQVLVLNSDNKTSIDFNPKEVVTEETINELCGKLKHMQRMMAIYQRQQSIKKANRL